MPENNFIVDFEDPILVTGATGFIGSRVVKSLLEYGFSNLRCFVRASSDLSQLHRIVAAHGTNARVAIVAGNLLSKEDCLAATSRVRAIFHLAASGSDKSFPDAFMNSVVTTRNLLDAVIQHKCLTRFINISSLAVYSNVGNPQSHLDETAPVEINPALRGDAYCYAKAKQDEIVQRYAQQFSIPYVIVRPGAVYGPGTRSITARVGIGTFGIFLHLGGSNKLPLTYVDNCADAILIAGLTPGVDGEVFNVIDDDLPSSRQFLRLHKRNGRRFPSLYIPHFLSYLLSYGWERYSEWSEEQLPPTFNRRRWRAYWKKTNYSNAKLKMRVGWRPRIATEEALRVYFASRQEHVHHA